MLRERFNILFAGDEGKNEACTLSYITHEAWKFKLHTGQI